jgi:hypothetical protein
MTLGTYYEQYEIFVNNNFNITNLIDTIKKQYKIKSTNEKIMNTISKTINEQDSNLFKIFAISCLEISSDVSKYKILASKKQVAPSQKQLEQKKKRLDANEAYNALTQADKDQWKLLATYINALENKKYNASSLFTKRYVSINGVPTIDQSEIMTMCSRANGKITQKKK